MCAFHSADPTAPCKRKAVMLRFNPDGFRQNGKPRAASKKDKLEKLVEIIKSCDADPAPEWQFARFFLFYDHTSDSELPVISS